MGSSASSCPCRECCQQEPFCTLSLLLCFQRAVRELAKAWQISNNELISMPSADRFPQQHLAPEQEISHSPSVSGHCGSPLGIREVAQQGNLLGGAWCVELDFGSIPPYGQPQTSLGTGRAGETSLGCSRTVGMRH